MSFYFVWAGGPKNKLAPLEMGTHVGSAAVTSRLPGAEPAERAPALATMFAFEASTCFDWDPNMWVTASHIKWVRPSGHMEGEVSWGGKMGFKNHKMELLTTSIHLSVLGKALNSCKSQFSYLQSGHSNLIKSKCFILPRSYISVTCSQCFLHV